MTCGFASVLTSVLLAASMGTRLLYLFTANGKHSVREDYCRAAMLINHKEKQTNSILHVQNNHDIKALIHECNKTCSPFYEETHKNACITS